MRPRPMACENCGKKGIVGKYCSPCGTEKRLDSYDTDSQPQTRRLSLKLYECTNCGHHYRAEGLSKCSDCGVAQCRFVATIADADGNRVSA